MANSNDWLAQRTEPVIAPDLPICDPHHHLWDHPANRYLLDELLADTNSGHNVVSTVFVECSSMYRHDGPAEMSPVGETEFVQGIAAMSASGNYGNLRAAAGIVSYADLTLGSRVRDVLEAHLAASPNRFRGIRHAAGWHASDAIRNSHTNPPAGLLLDRKFREGFQVLAELGMSFDAWLYHPQIDELLDLAREFPETTIIIDHFAGPLGLGPFAKQADAVYEQWRKSMRPLATMPNVYAKLGGINMPLNGFGWHRRDVPPSSEELAAVTGHYYENMIEWFGVDRCMFESNFPVDKVSCSYRTLWNAFKRIASGASDHERAALFHDTACRAYRLTD